MYSKDTPGNYYPIDSALHRLNPIVKLLNFIISIGIICFSNSLQIHLLLLSLVFIMCMLSYVPTKFYFNSFYSLRYFYILIVVLCAFFKLDLQTTLVYIFKLIIVIEYLSIIFYTTSRSELNYGIEKVLNVFNFLGLNMAVVANGITNVISFFPTLVNTGKIILKSQSSRGIDYNNSDIVGRLYAIGHIYKDAFRLTLHKMKKIKENAEIRLFNVRKYRTNYKTNRVGFYDLVFFTFHIFIVIALLADKGYLNEIFSKFNI